MNAGTLAMLAKIAGRISNASSLTPIYRSIEIANESMRCCSEFGNLEIWLDPTGIQEPSLLDTASVLAVANSLPPNAEIELNRTAARVNWKCGDARGHLNLVVQEHQIPKIQHGNFPWTPPEDFSDALLVASSACQAAAVSVGLYGIIIEPIGDRLKIMSSNSIALAASSVEKGDYPAGKITIRPPVPTIISVLLRACPGCKLDVTAEGIFISGDWLIAHLPLGVTLEHDLAQIADGFQAATQVAKVSPAALKKFIMRARSLSDRLVSFTVSMKIENGKLVLEHKGISSSTEEIFLAEGLPPELSYESVSLPGDMIVIPLDFTETAVFDYIGQQRLVLRGSSPEFLYVVSGGE